MASEKKDLSYTSIPAASDEDVGRRSLFPLRLLGLALCPMGIFASLVCWSNSTGSVTKDLSNHMMNLAALPLQTMTFGALPRFRGSTAEYFIEPSGRLSASLEQGTNSTMFILDHRLQYIVDGEIQITDGTGKVFLGKAGDIFYLAKGTSVTYFTPKSALSYLVVANKVPPIALSSFSTVPTNYASLLKKNANSTSIVKFSNIKDRKSSRFETYSKDLPSTTSSAFFDEIGCFKWKGEKLPSGKFPSWNFCGGIFYLKAGPPFTSYTYNHHYEVDFVLDGEFHYNPSSGEGLVARPGDLVHNPREKDIRIETPEFGKFLTISLSDVDDFWR